MTASPTIRTSGLRLVGADDAPVPAHEGRREVARENRAAAIAADDVRAAFAVEVARAIEGGRAAILRPEVRRALVDAAEGRGLRAFDAHLIIAVVQDAVRRAEPVAGPAPLLRVIGGGGRAGSMVVPWVLAVALGLAIFGALVAWVASV